jgi:enediyne biosynthesis protein E4
VRLRPRPTPQRIALALLALALVAGAGSPAAPGAALAGVTVTISASSASSMAIGSSVVVTATNKNTGPSGLMIRDSVYLIEPDSTRLLIGSTAAVSIGAGGSVQLSPDAITTSVFTTQTGPFSLEVDAVDRNGVVRGSAIYPFTILPLAAGPPYPRFADIAQAAGVDAVHHDDPTDCMNQIGSGVGWADYDGDGWLDLFVSDFNGPSHLYRSLMGSSGTPTFSDVTAAAFPGSVSAGQLVVPHGSGVTWADYDNDGDQDLLVSAIGHPYLFRNNGNGTFTDVTAAAGLAAMKYRGSSATWGDVNRDGLLDLYVVYYNQNCLANPFQWTPRAPDHLFGQTPGHTFTEMTSALGGTGSSAVNGIGFEASFFDYNNDLRPDLYVVNDFGSFVQPNVLWKNSGSSLQNVSAAAKANFAISSMGIGIGDYNRDGYFDVAVTNINPNILARGSSTGTFTDVGKTTGAQRSYVFWNGSSSRSVTWGLGFYDVNNDGYEDLMMAGGRLRPTETVASALLVNNLSGHLTGSASDSTFLDLTYRAGLSVTSGRTLAFADFDADGFVDVYEQNYYDQPGQLYRNQGRTDGNGDHWLSVRLVGAGPGPIGTLLHGTNRDGVGARLTLTSASGTQYRQIINGSSLGAGNQLAAHFGLGADTQVASLRINWPSGYTQTFTNLPVDQRDVITEGLAMIGTDPTS